MDIGLGGLVSRIPGAKKIEDKFGEVTPMTKKMSEGTGIVPTSTSMLVLIGYVLVAVGIIGQISS